MSKAEIQQCISAAGDLRLRYRAIDLRLSNAQPAAVVIVRGVDGTTYCFQPQRTDYVVGYAVWLHGPRTQPTYLGIWATRRVYFRTGSRLRLKPAGVPRDVLVRELLFIDARESLW